MLYQKIKMKLYENDTIRLYYYKTVKKILNKSAVRDCSKDEEEIEQSISEMQDYGKKQGKRLLVSGHIGLSPRTPFLAKMQSFLPEEYEVMQLIENGADYKRLREKKWEGITPKEYERLKQFIAPSIFLKDTFVSYQKVKVAKKDKELIKERPYLMEAFENLKERHFNMDKSFIAYFVVLTYRYLNKVVDTLEPDCVMLWNQFFAFHHIFEGICKERKIKCMYFEFGVLPGTYAVEAMGQMGESYPAQKFTEFKDLEVTEEEIEKAKEICQYIKNNKVNRKVQPDKDINKILDKHLMKGRPTIFYAGQNDFESGLQPYTEHTARYHSPIFKSSDEVVFYLAKLAKKNEWNLIYKMHPLVSRFCFPPKLPSNVILINDADINDMIEKADLTVTILSQTGYVALFNEKPVLMLGYMQLKGKGCNYEAFQKEQVEDEIKKALEHGFTDEQKRNYVRHIAQIAKYYVFNDDWFQKEISYGRSIEECAEFIEQYMENGNEK